MSKLLGVLTVIIMVLNGCTKPAGEGGRAKIEGVVYENQYDHKGQLIRRVEAPNERIYLIYGENVVADDDIDSHYNGVYEFNYLRKGDYTLFAYSDCLDCDEETPIVSQKITLEKNNETKVVDIETVKILDPNDGGAIAKGKVWIQQYLGSTPFEDPFVAQDVEVFITYDTDTIYFDKMDTDAEGNYLFDDLIMGSYSVHAYSQCPTCVNVQEISKQSFNVSDYNEVVAIPALTIRRQL